jgi:hypothetical protein
MAEKLVVIARFSDGGIEAVVTGANASSVYPVPAIEGPEVQVLDSQARKARRILKFHQGQEL